MSDTNQTLPRGVASPRRNPPGPVTSRCQTPSAVKKTEVHLNRKPWFHGNISRQETESLLKPRENGLFLVRESTNFKGDYALSVCVDNKVEHYRIVRKGMGFIIKNKIFPTIQDVITFCESNADLLCTKLTRFIPKQDEFEVDPGKAFLEAGWIVDRFAVTITRQIGCGEFGQVYLGDFGGQKVAVKKMNSLYKDKDHLLIREAENMTSLHHSNIVSLVGLVLDCEGVLLLMEFLENGSLVDYLRSRGRLQLNIKGLMGFAIDVARALEHLERKKFVHGDIAARNVLLASNVTAKLSDFGLASKSNFRMKKQKTAIKWTAPEVRDARDFSNKSDVWSYGVLLWEIFSFGRVPYPNIKAQDVQPFLEKGGRMDRPTECPLEIFSFMKTCWFWNPADRPCFQETLSYLLGINRKIQENRLQAYPASLTSY